MILKVDRDAERAHKILAMPEVREAMAIRCEESDHDWENCCDAFLRVYQACKWCGVRR